MKRARQIADYISAAYCRRALKTAPRKLVAIVVPLSQRSYFTPDEEISLRHLERHLGSYDRYFVAPRGFEVERAGFRAMHFSSHFFGSLVVHRDLVLSPQFYAAFRDYEFMLIYHLDALVFSDQLREWCAKPYDYIGAPWVKHPDAPYAGNAEYEDKVGNGGFSLRRIGPFLRLLLSRRSALDPQEYTRHRPRSMGQRLGNGAKRMLMRTSLVNNVRWEVTRLPYVSEERFLANRAAYYDPEFRIAPLGEALEFAFECVPSYCFELNRRRLPFGCHAWQRYDPEFWEPYLLRE